MKGGDPTTDNYVVTGGSFDDPKLFSIMPMNSGKDYKAREVEIAQPVMTSQVGGNQGGDFVVTHALRADGFDASEDGTGRGTPIVPVAYRTSGNCGAWETGDKTDALTTATDPNSHVVAFTIHGTDKTATVASETDVAGSVRTKAPGSIENSSTTVALAFEPRYYAENRQRPGGAPSETVATLKHSPKAGDTAAHIATGMAVRRLTPRECERLQGFSDDYTLVPYRGKPASDGPRYKAIGNSWAVPVLNWIASQILAVDDL